VTPASQQWMMVDLTVKSGTSLSLQNDACTGTISFISEKVKDKVIKQYKKESSSLWKAWEVTDSFDYLTVLYDYGFEEADGEVEAE
jgi:hypothetical protein